MTPRPLTSKVPLVLLLGYGIGFASVALGPGLVFDDHPGQIHRLAHVLTVGAAPWRWNPGWWAGYAELQFYPPGFSYLGAVVHRAGLGAMSIEQAYRAALWIAYLLPGVATQLLLGRVLRDSWLALPWAFLALTLSAGSRSGVEEGVRWGLVAARLGWGLLPLLALSLVRWVEGAPRISRATAPLLAAIVLVHPTHAPAAICLLAGAAVWAKGPIAGRARAATRAVALGLGLAAFWLLPFLVHHHMALPLAWGDGSPAALGLQIWQQPLLVLLVAASAGALVAHARLRAATPAAV
ncbi:MAG TPA: hypothetical protein VMN37_01140, partial [Gemmatimonadales bacterium]|nr:hypothetical protein [Gemmatimonadales bacterium]